MSAPTAVEVLSAHHEELRGLLRALEDSADDDVALRRRTLDRLVSELTVHTQLEDEIFYPAVRDVSPLLSVAHAEHRQIDEQLATVLRTGLRGPALRTEVRMLAATVHHHTLEEEERMFPQSAALGPERQQALGRELQQRRHELSTQRRARLLVAVERFTLRHL